MGRMKLEKTETRTYTFPKSMVKDIQAFAVDTERTESSAVRFIIKRYFEEHPDARKF